MKIYCAKCEAQNDEVAPFCSSCGHPLQESEVIGIGNRPLGWWVRLGVAVVVFGLGMWAVVGTLVRYRVERRQEREAARRYFEAQTRNVREAVAAEKGGRESVAVVWNGPEEELGTGVHDGAARASEEDRRRAAYIARVSDARTAMQVASAEQNEQDLVVAKQISEWFPEISRYSVDEAVGWTSGLDLSLDDRTDLAVIHSRFWRIGERVESPTKMPDRVLKWHLSDLLARYRWKMPEALTMARDIVDDCQSCRKTRFIGWLASPLGSAWRRRISLRCASSRIG